MKTIFHTVRFISVFKIKLKFAFINGTLTDLQLRRLLEQVTGQAVVIGMVICESSLIGKVVEVP
jgi:hypothetical protein